MNQSLALHTLARQYCQERSTCLRAQYDALCASGGRNSSDNESEYSDEALRLFPRFLVLEAILDQLEQIETPVSSSYESFRAELNASGCSAESVLTVGLAYSVTSVVAMADERADFEGYLDGIDESTLRSVEPSMYRRVLGPEELMTHWGKLERLWRVDREYWWPLREEQAPFALMSFHEDWFQLDKIQVARDLLMDQGINRVFELREFRRWGCEREVATMELDYAGEEGYWFSKDYDWLIYASHESSITLASDRLVDLS